MGHCTRCGAPCTACNARYSNYTVNSLPKSIREPVKTLLVSMGAKPSDADHLSQTVMAYPETKVLQAIRIWKGGQYSQKGKGVNYFLAILAGLATEKINRNPIPPHFTQDQGGEDSGK